MKVAQDMGLKGQKKTVAEVLARRAAAVEALRLPSGASGAGPVRVTRAFELLAGGTRRAVGERVCRMDAFDEMERRARGQWVRLGEQGVFTPPFTAGQVSEGRRYASVVQAYEAGLCKGQNLYATGGGDGTSAMDRYLEVGVAVRAYRARIGGGVGHSLRRVRPSASGVRFTDQQLVDWVCVEGRTVGWVLKAQGWQVNGRYREAVREALAGALDRMQGYGGG